MVYNGLISFNLFSMDTVSAIKTRYSCREYSSKQIPHKVLLELLELANRAPSGCNLQNRQFLVITDPRDREFLYKMNNQIHVKQAPAIVVVTTKLDHYGSAEKYLEYMEKFDMTSWDATIERYRDNKKFVSEYEKFSKLLIPISDAAAATMTLILAATDKGIDSCWVGIFDEEQMKKRFNIPHDQFIVSMVALGYRANEQEWRTTRKPIKELVHWGKW